MCSRIKIPPEDLKDGEVVVRYWGPREELVSLVVCSRLLSELWFDIEGLTQRLKRLLYF